MRLLRGIAKDVEIDSYLYYKQPALAIATAARSLSPDSLNTLIIGSNFRRRLDATKEKDDAELSFQRCDNSMTAIIDHVQKSRLSVFTTQHLESNEALLLDSGSICVNGTTLVDYLHPRTHLDYLTGNTSINLADSKFYCLRLSSTDFLRLVREEA